MGKQQYKGFTIAKGNPMYTHECYSIRKGRGINEQYYGGADTVAQAKEKIDNGIKRVC